MPPVTKLTAPEIERALRDLPGWTLQDGSLYRKLEFHDFREAFAFMTGVALAAEAMNHHPDWSNSYKTVEVRLVTHSAGGVTELDLRLAREVSRLA